jgi:hypothetical protein
LTLDLGSSPLTTQGKTIMELVSFISIEDDPPDLILSFANEMEV